MNSKINLYEITDGNFYGINDLVKADTGGCVDCSACCYGVGELVILTPYDVYEMSSYLELSFDELLIDKIKLQHENKITLPHLNVISGSDRCSFLSESGRCQIHAHRPSICRLFPLGRVYEDDDFKFFLQTNSCVKENLTSIKVENWIGISNYNENKKFLLTWHKLLKALNFRVKFIRDEQELKAINTDLLDTFFKISHASSAQKHDDFYSAFYAILPEAKKRLGIL